jgi:hypothetical protein
MKRRTAAVLAALTGLVAGPFVSTVVGAGPVAVSTVAVFANGDYVDLDAVTSDGEVENVIEDLAATGHTAEKFTDISAAGWSAALDGANVLVIPELEAEEPEGALSTDMTQEARDVVADWVAGGGRILWFGSSDPTTDINAIFGFSLEHLDEFCFPEEEPIEDVAVAAIGDCVLTAAAAETELADGPPDLAYVDDSTSLVPDSLPEGSTIFYEGVVSDTGPQTAGIGDGLPIAAAVSMPHGDGAVLFLGWDWYPDSQSEGDAVAAAPADEAEWAVVLDLAVSQPEVAADSPAPGALRLRMDSPSTQPVLVVLVIDGTTHTVPIAAKTTEANFDVGGVAVIEWSVPGWGIGEGTVEVGGAAAEPVPVAPTFTG